MTKSRIVTIDSEADPLLNASCFALHLQYRPDDELIRQIVSIQESIRRVSKARVRRIILTKDCVTIRSRANDSRAFS